MFSEVLLVACVGVAGAAIGSAVLFLLLGKNMNTRIFMGLVPGISFLIITVYTWNKLGGIYNYFMTALALSLGIGALVVNLAIITRKLRKTLGHITDSLSQCAKEVASESSEISSSSQQLAQGASEQAASIEETSASLKEMSAMTKQNADHSSEADSLSKENKTTTDICSNTMQEMAAAIGQVSEASQETQKIVKTIDEIAFQTNLLALNAAVEAARAGDVGAGFSVVADEVRNLAMRAAEAARNTTNQINNISSKIEEAMEMVFKTIDSFCKVHENTIKVSELVSEISAASIEQAQGIEQVNKAVLEIDKVVQQNAANAEESASTSEVMTSQGKQMEEMIRLLVSFLDGKANGMKNGQGLHDDEESELGSGIGTTLQFPLKEAKEKELAVMDATELSARERFPMDDDDFKDF